MFHTAEHIANKLWDTYWRGLERIYSEHPADSLSQQVDAYHKLQSNLDAAGVVQTLEGWKFKC